MANAIYGGSKHSNSKIISDYKKCRSSLEKAAIGNEIIKSYIPLVMNLVRKIQKSEGKVSKVLVQGGNIVFKYSNNGNHGLDEDFLQEGFRGLWKAVKRYNPEKKAQFATYATYWIKQCTREYKRDNDPFIRKPGQITELHSKYLKLSEDKSMYKIKNIKKVLKISTKLAERVSSAYSTSIVSLDKSTDEYNEGETTIGDVIPSKKDDGKTENNYLKDEIFKILDKFPERQRRVIELRFGLNGTKPYTLEEIGKRFKITRERVRQIERKILIKLEVPCRYLNN